MRGASGSSSALAETPMRKAREMSNRVPVEILGGGSSRGRLSPRFRRFPRTSCGFVALGSPVLSHRLGCCDERGHVSSSPTGRRRSAAGERAKLPVLEVRGRFHEALGSVALRHGHRPLRVETRSSQKPAADQRSSPVRPRDFPQRPLNPAEPRVS